MACAWYFIATFDGNNDDSWPVNFGVIDEDPFFIYIVSLYWAEQVITTVGYGDLNPGLQIEYFTAVLWMMFGASFYSFLASNISSLVASLDVRAQLLQYKLGTLQRYAIRIQLPTDTSLKIQKWVENEFKILHTVEQQNELVNQLPATLRLQVV